MDANVTKLEQGEGWTRAEVRAGPDPDQALRDIIAALKVDDHDAYEMIEGETRESLFDIWLAGNYAGCYSCQAAFIARAALERRNYKRPNELP